MASENAKNVGCVLPLMFSREFLSSNPTSDPFSERILWLDLEMEVWKDSGGSLSVLQEVVQLLGESKSTLTGRWLMDGQGVDRPYRKI